VAETLGTAELVLTVNDQALRDGLKKARRLIEDTSADVGRRGRTGDRSTARPATSTIEPERRLASERRRTAAESLKAIKAEEQQRQLTARRRKDILSNAIIGGAFPLLFGQGVGASFGGAAGGAAGGALGGQFGFGLSLIGTALGAQFDTLLNKSKELADALQDPIAAFDQLKQASALSSRGLETYIQALINSGQTAKAEQLIRQDLTQNFNPVTADALSQANDELARSFSDVQEKLAAILAGPSIAFLEWLDDILDRLPINGPGGRTGQLPSAASAQQQVEAGQQNQRLGLGLGLASLGTIGLGAALTASGAGAPAGLALLAYSLLGVGTGLVGKGKFQESQGSQALTDRETDSRTVAVQREIEAIQARRVTLQRQLVGLTGDENSAAGQIAQAQNAVLTAEKAALEARKRFLSLPVTSSAEEFATALAEFKAGIAAARIEVEKFIATNNNQARSLRKDNNLSARTIGFTPAARQGAELSDATRRSREEYDKAQSALRQATPGTDEYRVLQSLVNKIGEEWRGAALKLADYNAELDRSAQRQKDVNADTLTGLRQQSSDIDRLSRGMPGPARDRLAISLDTARQVNESKREEVRLEKELERLKVSGTQAEVDNAAALLEQARERTILAEKEGKLRLKDAKIASLRSLDTPGLDAAVSVAADQFIEAGKNAKAAADSLRSAKEGAFKFLNENEQRKLLSQARTDFSKVSIFKPLGNKVSDEEVLAAGAAARSVLNAQDQYQKANQDLITATQNLANKDWRVNVNVRGGDVSAFGDVVNGALAT
jgi:hypothetical protein